MNNSKPLKEETEKPEGNKISFLLVLKETSKMKLGFSFQLFMFSFITILCLMLAYVVPLTLIATIPFVIIPSFFAFVSVNASVSDPKAPKMPFFVMFRTYFSNIFFGGYRVLIGLLKAIVATTLVETILNIIFQYTIFPTIPGYNEIISKAESLSDFNKLLEEFMAFAESNPTIIQFTNLATAIALVVGILMFVHHFAKYSLIIRRNMYKKPPLPNSQLHFVYRLYRKENRTDFIKTYLRSTWLYQLLLVLVAGAGITLSFFFIKDITGVQMAIITAFLMFVVSLPFFNFLFKFEELLYFAICEPIEKRNIDETIKFLNQIKQKENIDPELSKSINDFLEKHRKNTENPGENKENKEEK